MSYFVKKEVLITPIEGQRIVRNCSKCGGRAIYINTENFRVNANGNAVDVWLIYQCEKCKTTYNLSIYERVRPKSIPREEYESYISNDRELAWKVSYTPSILKANHIEIDTSSINYDISVQRVEGNKKSKDECVHQDENKSENVQMDLDEEHISVIQIQNPYQLRIRLDRILSEVLGQSRTEVKRNYEDGTLVQVFYNNVEQGHRLEDKVGVTINKACVYKQVNFQYRRKNS